MEERSSCRQTTPTPAPPPSPPVPFRISNGGTTGTLGTYTGSITNNGTLIFKRSDAVALNNVVTGSGGVAQNGTGTLSLTGNNTYTGQTAVTAGTLDFTSGTSSIGNFSVSGGILKFSGGNVTAASGAGTWNAW